MGLLPAIGLMMAIQQDYIDEQVKWRAEAESRLKQPEGWLTVAGLIWLKPGENRFGADKDNEVPLPVHSGSKAVVGSFVLSGKKVLLVPVVGSTVNVDGEQVGSVPIRTDADGRPNTITVGSVTFRVIVRGKRVGVRLYDSACRGMLEFKGRHWFPVNPKLRIVAKFIPYTPAKKVGILNILGDTESATVPGYVTFKLGGKTIKLDAQDEGDTLFFNFRDGTSGKETYGAGRFLNTPRPANGQVVMDFNQAVNPPCAFTAFATCPLPPKNNILTVPIKAGELTHHPVH